MESKGFVPMMLAHKVAGGADGFDWAQSLPGQILHTGRMINARLAELLAPFGLSVSEARALVTLVRDGAMNQQSLAAALGVTKGNIVQLVDRLSQRGYVERVKRADDRRENMLGITPAGKAAFDTTMPVIEAWFRDAMSTIPEELRKTCCETLHVIASVMKPDREPDSQAKPHRLDADGKS